MTDEQIQQNAEEYAKRHEKVLNYHHDEQETDFKDKKSAYLAGAYSRDEEIRELLEKFTYEIDSLIAQKEDLQEELESLRKSFYERGDKLKELMLANNKFRNPWISVEDRLPNLEDVVFFRLPKGRPYVGSYFTKDKLFMSIEGCYFVEGVTHWMPIPELKKEE